MLQFLEWPGGCELLLGLNVSPGSVSTERLYETVQSEGDRGPCANVNFNKYISSESNDNGVFCNMAVETPALQKLQPPFFILFPNHRSTRP